MPIPQSKPCTSASEVARYILRKCLERRGEKISGLKLQKLLFYAQAYYLALYNQPLFGDRIEAWSHGPVVPSVNSEYEKYGLDVIDRDVADPHLHLSVCEHIDEVLEAYGNLSGKSLQQMTHQEPPWLDARRGLASEARSGPEINNTSIAAFYRTQLILEDPSNSATLPC